MRAAINSLRHDQRVRQSLLLALPVLVILAWTVAWPNVSVIRGSFEHGLGYWKEFANSPSDREALFTSIWISVLSDDRSFNDGDSVVVSVARTPVPLVAG